MFDKQKVSKPEETGSDISASAPSSSVPTSPVSSPRASAVIGATINIKGEVSGDENLIIEGTVEGTINLGSKHVTVGQSGRVEANIDAQVIKVDGEVKGDMSGKEKVVVSKTGKVQGNIVAPRVTLEDGAKFKGSIDMDPTDKGASETAVTPIKKATQVEAPVEKPATNSAKSG